MSEQVWIVQHSGREGLCVVAVFSSELKAQTYIERQQSSRYYYAEAFTVDPEEV